jgi:hypothetical protein
MKNDVFWDVAGPLDTVNIVPSTQILSTLKMETTHSSETSIVTRPTRLHSPEDDILQITFNKYSCISVYLSEVIISRQCMLLSLYRKLPFETYITVPSVSFEPE